MQLIAVEVNHDVGNSKCLTYRLLSNGAGTYRTNTSYTYMYEYVYTVSIEFLTFKKCMQNYAGDQANLEKAGLKAINI